MNKSYLMPGKHYYDFSVRERILRRYVAKLRQNCTNTRLFDPALICKLGNSGARHRDSLTILVKEDDPVRVRAAGVIFNTPDMGCFGKLLPVNNDPGTFKTGFQPCGDNIFF